MAKDRPQNIGDYEIQDELGSGSVGAVYKAQHKVTKKIVAVKIFRAGLCENEASRERFRTEAKVLVDITHANVVRTLEFGEQDERLYLVTEHFDGKSLASVLRSRRLTLHETLAIIRHVCQGMWTAHSKGTIHHCLNPKNILVNQDFSKVKISDLGISMADEATEDFNTLSTGQTLSGSLHYLAPEQATDNPEVDQRTNVYSVGVLFYEMLTGKVPFGRFNLPSSLNADVPSDFDTIVLKCLASDPADRYATIGRLLKDIFDTEDRLNLNIVSDLRGLSRSTSSILSRGTASLRKKKMIAGMVAVAAIAGIGGFVAWRSISRDAMGSGSVPQPVSQDSQSIDALDQVEPLAQIEPSDTIDTNDSLDHIEQIDPSETNAENEVDSADDPKSAELSTPEKKSVKPVTARPKVESTDTPEAKAQLDSKTEPGSKDSVTEDYRIARSKYEAKLYGPALADLDSLQDNYPDSPEALAAYFLMAEIHEVEGNIEEAMGTYVEIQSRYPNDPRHAEIRYRLGRLTLRTDGQDRFSRAIEILEGVVTDYPTSSWAPKSLRVKAGVEAARNLRYDDPELGPKVPAEVFTYRQLLTSYPDDEGAEEALWHLGEAYEEIKSYEHSAKSFSELARRFPKTKNDAWWRVAQIYDRKLDDKEKAIAAYGQVPESSEHHRDAQKRLQKLKG